MLKREIIDPELRAMRRTLAIVVAIMLAATAMITGAIVGIATYQPAADTLTAANIVATTTLTSNSGATESFGGALDMTSHQVHNVTDPSSAQDVATQHFIVSSSSAQFTTSTQGVVPASGGGTTNYLRADGTWAAPSGGGGGGSPSITITDAAGVTGTKSLTTEGTIDWVDSVNLAGGGNYYGSSMASIHSKAQGGWFMRTMWWAAYGGSTTTSTYGATFTSTAADDSSNAALSSTSMAVIFTSGSSISNFGGNAVLPANTSQRVARFYVSVNNCTVTTDALLTLSGTTQTENFNIGAVQTDKLITVTYTGGSTGDQLSVRFRCTTNNGSGSLSFAAASLGTT